jgi:hypothetical protein
VAAKRNAPAAARKAIVEPVPSQPGPAFFLSYARAAQRGTRVSRTAAANQSIRKLFDDLSERLLQMVPLEPGHDLGFMDSHIETGTEWTPELLKTLSTCRVFVALLSEPYLHRSEWCPMEWHLFSRRRVTQVRPGAQFASGMIPVTWTPMRLPTPPLVRKVQRFQPTDLPAEILEMYDKHGLFGMSQIDAEAYKAVTWVLASEIHATLSTVVVAHASPRARVGLRRSFAGGAK